MSPIPEPQALTIDALSQDCQGWSMYMFPSFPLFRNYLPCHPRRPDNSNCAQVAITTVVPTPTLTVCGPPSLLFIQPKSTVTTGIHLGWKVVPSARMEAVMQLYQAAGFSEEVSRLAAAPQLQLAGDP